jgi:hypothetical protein
LDHPTYKNDGKEQGHTPKKGKAEAMQLDGNIKNSLTNPLNNPI